MFYSIIEMSNSIPSLERSCRLLETVLREPTRNRHPELAQVVGMSATTCYRALKTFETAGWLRLEGDLWQVGERFRGLCRTVNGPDTLESRVEQELHRLAAETGLSAKYSVRNGDEAVTRLRVSGSGEFALASRIGATFPLGVGSSGAVLMMEAGQKELARVESLLPNGATAVSAFRRRVRQARSKGWCRDRGSHHPSVHSLSAPVRNGTGQLAGALSLIGLPEQFIAEDTLRDALLDSVRRVQEEA